MELFIEKKRPHKKSIFRPRVNKKMLSIKLEERKSLLSAFEEKLENTQGWSIYLQRQIRSKDLFGKSDIQFLENLQRQLVLASRYFKKPSSVFIQASKFSIEQWNFPHPKALFMEIEGVLLHSISITEKTSKVFLRRKVNQFLDTMSQYYDLYIFTQKPKNQAQKLVDRIDPFGKYFVDILSRQQCLFTKKNKRIKNLKIIKNKNINSMIMLDTSVYSFALNVGNGIPILPFSNPDQNDDELEMLIPLLIEASSAVDVRQYLSRQLKLREIVEEALQGLKK